MIFGKHNVTFTGYILVSLITLQLASCCTDFIVGCKDGATIHGRTMEYDFEFPCVIRSQPAGYRDEAVVPESCANVATSKLSWKAQYPVLFINSIDKFSACNRTWIDGQNSEGLSAGSLYFEQYAAYAKEVPKEQCGNAISHLQMVNFLLANFATVNEVRLAFKEDTFPMVWEEHVRYWEPNTPVIPDFVFPLHWSVADRTGDAIVIEYTNEGRRIHENEIGVMTNSPTYDWHQTNLKTYINIQNTGFPAKHYTRHDKEYTIKPFGLGTGFLGLPGDFTSPSRFIRTAAMLRFSGDAVNAKRGVLKALHILNSVDITKGTSEDFTTWAIAKDLTNNIMYIRAHDYVSIRSINMNNLPNNSSVWMMIEGSFDDSIKDVTDKMIH